MWKQKVDSKSRQHLFKFQRAEEKIKNKYQKEVKKKKEYNGSTIGNGNAMPGMWESGTAAAKRE